MTPHLHPAFGLLLLPCLLAAHDLPSGHGHGDGGSNLTPAFFNFAQAKPPTPASIHAPGQTIIFKAFAPAVTTRWDGDFFYVESDGLPAHNMMVGITSWQQQVPLPQAYRGANAWRIPLRPVPAKTPAPIKGSFLRGAIALAANGIPIFNPQNNRGEVSQEIGELDQWGGHCGRADDYHYHIVPLHLQDKVGKGSPVAYALDGYPILGLTEPDGSAPKQLDACHGHETPGLGYHYHASTSYPYVFAAFHGEVVEREGQVDPQPRATSVREAGTPLRGASITAFESPRPGVKKLTYQVSGESRSVTYTANADGSFTFEFDNGKAGKTTETYRAQQRPGRQGEGRRGGGQGGQRPPEGKPLPEPRPSAQPAAPVAPVLGFKLSSPEIPNPQSLPIAFTGDGDGVSPPLSWSGLPAGTKSLALIMHHTDPEGVEKYYWVLHHLPPTLTSLPRAVSKVGVSGVGFRGQTGYEPPKSKGPGAKTYTLSLYALSEEPKVSAIYSEVTGDALLAAMRGKILARADLPVSYARAGGEEPARPSDQGQRPRPPRPAGDAQGIVKPTLDDTVRAHIYADNWFMLYLNGKLVAVDSIDFLPHNVVSVDILPEYPLTIAVLAKDNADPKTGMEYGNHIGDGGFILKFSDGTCTNASWKAKAFFRGPMGRDTANPKVENIPLPPNWFATDFDDSSWPAAVEYSEERVGPKEAFTRVRDSFSGARHIWTADLDLDNTVVFRARIEKSGWKARWTTKPDLDVSGAPVR